MIVENENLAWSIEKKNDAVVSLEFFGIVDTPEGNFCEGLEERYYSEEIEFVFKDDTLILLFKTPYKETSGIILTVPQDSELALRNFLEKTHLVKRNADSSYHHVTIEQVFYFAQDTTLVN